MNKRNLKQKNTMPFTLVSKKMKCLGLDLTKHLNLYRKTTKPDEKYHKTK